jgi:hypothetical protein
MYHKLQARENSEFFQSQVRGFYRVQTLMTVLGRGSQRDVVYLG